MRILITNDDGINAPGLKVLAEIARDIAGPDGEVWTVAPAFEQSGVGHAISYTHPTMLAEMGPRLFAAEGSPADCVMAGLYEVMKDTPPDLVLSGVNRGNNAGENVLYSGTIGAAMEAILQGVPAIALSQFMGPENAGLDDPFECARVHGTKVVKRILDLNEWGQAPYRTFYNVNFPALPAAATTGVEMTYQGYRNGARHTAQQMISPTGRRFLWVHSGEQNEMTGAGTDVQTNVEGRISVTPLQCDLTDYNVLPRLQAAFDTSL